MKILYAGNTANFGYVVTHHMRKINVNMELLMQKNSSVVSDPIIRDTNLNGIYPPWINFYDKSKPQWKISILKKMQNYDLIQANTGLIIYAYLSKKPYIVQPIGSELRVTAFSKSLKGSLMRRSLRSAKVVIVSTLNQELLLKKLNIKNYFLIPCYPEFSFFYPQITSKSNFDTFTIFHPTNLNWEIKGNNLLIQGFAQFLKIHPQSSLHIVEHGKDIEKTHKLVKTLHIEQNVKFIKGPLSYEQLKHYYHNADVIADQFIGDEIGAIGREVLCSQKPLICNFDESIYSAQFGTAPPILKAKSSDEICSKLEFLLDENIRKNYGINSRLWMEQNNSMDIFSEKNKIICESILAKERFETLKNRIDNYEIT